MTGAPLIRIEGLGKAYRPGGPAALDGVNLVIAEGETFGLLGLNGAGKTTLISMLCGMLAPSSGRVQFRTGDDAWVAPATARAFTGLVPQDLAFYPTLTVAENLRFFASMHGLTGERLQTGIEQGVDIGRLASVRGQRADTLSGGLRRRLNLAIGIVHAPRILVLDEPTAGMDPQSRQLLREALVRLNAAGTTIVYTSHHLEEVAHLCRTIAVLDRGRLIAHGSLDRFTRAGVVRIECAGEVPATLVARLTDLDAQRRPHVTGNMVHLTADDPTDVLARALAEARSCAVEVVAASSGRRDLESMFFELTGAAAPEDAAD